MCTVLCTGPNVGLNSNLKPTTHFNKPAAIKRGKTSAARKPVSKTKEVLATQFLANIKPVYVFIAGMLTKT